MSAIEVERVGVGSSDSRCVYEVFIDGQARGGVKCGETRIFEVPPGVHSVKLGLDLYNSPPVKVVVGLGKTSLICQTRSPRRFPFFSQSEPSTKILVREEVEMVAPAVRTTPRLSPLDAPWQPEVLAWNDNNYVAPDRMAAD